MLFRSIYMNTFMRGPTVQVSDDDEELDIQKSSSFQIPRVGGGNGYISPPTGAAGPNLGTDMLINRRKVSNEVMSLSSSSRDGSEYSESDAGSPRRTPVSKSPSPPQYQQPSYQQPSYQQPSYQQPSYQQQSRQQFESESETETVSDNGPNNNQNDGFSNRFRAERSRLESELDEKKEILYQMDRLEAKGYNLPRKFSMQSDLEEMRAEYHRILREKEIDASIQFQRKALMFCVSGIEFLNNRFDPFSAKLDGWSEQVHDRVSDYDDIFEELHEKYKGSGQKMAPELRLLLGVGGSAFMYHLTQSDFERFRTKIVSINNDKFRNISEWNYFPTYRIYNQSRYTPMLVHKTDKTIEKPLYLKFKCDNCDDIFIHRDMEIIKNQYKLLCKNCSFTNKKIGRAHV